MLFNSSVFFVFLVAVFGIYWFLLKHNLRLQNSFLVLASYVFYGWWDYRFLVLIIISSLADFLIARKLGKVDDPVVRKSLLVLSLCVNIGILGFFKYFNFFIDSFVDLSSTVGLSVNAPVLNIVLPVGISFYTFQTLSYTIDVYRRKLDPCTNMVTFFAYVSFFPQLVAGPIERATRLLPQFEKPRVFSQAKAEEGVRQMLWGFFKKIAIADVCAVHVNTIFSQSESMPGSMLVLGAFYFAFQIYGDFSGYSDIAIGCAKLFGFDLMTNFRYPYFSRDIAEFWRRWHISLSTWFRDYLYIPLGGSRGTKWQQLRNVIIIFVVSGFWHGANWTFIAWGALNAIYFIPLLLGKRNRQHMDTIAAGRFLPSFPEFVKVLVTFGLTLIAWVFFRAESVGHAVSYLMGMTTGLVTPIAAIYLIPMVFIVLMLGIEWVQREEEHVMVMGAIRRPFRFAFYLGLVFLIIANVSANQAEFIYFQF